MSLKYNGDWLEYKKKWFERIEYNYDSHTNIKSHLPKMVFNSLINAEPLVLQWIQMKVQNVCINKQ